MLDIENFDYKFKNIIQSMEWKELQNVFNKDRVESLILNNKNNSLSVRSSKCDNCIIS